MQITTFLFAGFVIIACAGFRLLPRRYKSVWLLFTSAVFIISWSWKFLVPLLLIAVINYFAGRYVSSPRRGKMILWSAIVVNILALLFLKYNNFFLADLITLLGKLGIRIGAGGVQLLAPLGISFITLQMISYLIDIYYQRVEAEGSFIKFALYLVYFPKILAGPIERIKPFLDQVDAPQELSEQTVKRSISLVIVGLVRKLILADTLIAAIPADVFQKPSQYPALLLALWLLAYAFALYNDFAGYTNIIRGISGFFGIELTNNFNVPYFSRNFSEFWTRWHISLSNWLRNYIYFPLSRYLIKKIPDRNREVHFILPPLITMLVSGLWHGLSWSTFVWGGMHGCFLIFEQLFNRGKARISLDVLPKWRQVLSALGVFFCVVMAWVPFHTGLSASLSYWQSLFSITRQFPNLQDVNFIAPTVVLATAVVMDIFQYKNEFFFLKWPGWLQSALLAAVILTLFLMSSADKGAPFIYQSF
jgi:D-alanyl-lipoteichoic acid acyltransferase DltB (MBOAT superfamily)